MAAEELAQAIHAGRRITGPKEVAYGGYDVTTLGLDCSHGEDCPVRRAEAI